MPTPLHLLVVDDQPHITGYLKEVLESMGHRVDTAGNGIEAMNAIDSRRRAQDPHDLVIADITMPLLDGLSMIKELRRAKDPIDVALMTGNAEMITRLTEDVQRLGCIAVLAKPIDTVHLGQVLDFATMRQSRAIAIRTAAHTRNAQSSTLENSSTQHRRATGGPPDTGEYKPTAVPSSRQPPHVVTPPVPPRQTDQRFVSGFHTPAPQAPQVPAAPPRPANDPRYVSRVMPPQSLPPVPGSGFSQQQQQSRYQPPQTPQQQLPQRGVPPVARPVGDPRQPQAPLRPEGRPSPQPAPPALGGVALPQLPYIGQDQRAVPPALEPRPASPPQAIPPRARSIDQRSVPMRTPLPAVPPATDIGTQRDAPPPDALNQSSRLRRTVVGTVTTPLPAAAPESRADQARMVACAYCRGSFRAQIKPVPYNQVCVHCGQLNRIDP